MCGIAGISSANQNDLIDKQLVEDMIDLLIHRGPDGYVTTMIKESVLDIVVYQL